MTIIRRLKSNGIHVILKAFFQLSAARGVAQAAALAAIPFVTLFYDKETVGTAVAILAVARLVAAGGGVCYQNAIPIAKTERQTHSLLVLSLSACAIIFFLFFIIFSLVNHLKNIADFSAVFIISGFVFIQSTVLILTNFALRLRHYDFIAIGTIINGLFCWLTVVTFGFYNSSPSAYLFGYLVGALFFSVYLYFSLNPMPRKQTPPFYLIKVAKRYATFPLIVWPSTVANSAGSNLTVIAVALFYGTSSAGLYSIAERLALAPVTLLGQSFGKVFIGELSNILRSNSERAFKVFCSLLLVTLVPAVAVCVLVVFFGEWLIDVISPGEWQEAGVILSMLGPVILFRMLGSSLGRVFVILEKHRWILIWNLTRLVITFLAFWVSFLLSLDLIDAIKIFGSLWITLDIVLIFAAGFFTYSRSTKDSGRIDQNY